MKENLYTPCEQENPTKHDELRKWKLNSRKRVGLWGQLGLRLLKWYGYEYQPEVSDQDDQLNLPATKREKA